MSSEDEDASVKQISGKESQSPEEHTEGANIMTSSCSYLFPVCITLK